MQEIWVWAISHPMFRSLSAPLVLHSMYSTVYCKSDIQCSDVVYLEKAQYPEWVKSHLCVKLQGAYGALTSPIPTVKVESRASIAIPLLLFTQSNPPLLPNRDWPDKTAEWCACVVYVFVCVLMSVHTRLPVWVFACASMCMRCCACLCMFARPFFLWVPSAFCVCADIYSEPCTFWGQNVATSCHKTKTAAGKQEGGWRCTGTAAMFPSRPLF